MTTALITHPDCLLHDNGPENPECPARLRSIFSELERTGLSAILRTEDAPLASRKQLSRVHTENYIDFIFAKTPQQGSVQLEADTSMNPFTLTAALRAAGAVAKGVDLVLNKKVETAFCCIRPPGHHAEPAHAMGFCFFNNIAVGVAQALEQYKLKRVAIVDFDAHRGNGTDKIFQNDKRVLICSMFEEGLYPLDVPLLHSTNIINIPLEVGMTGREFRSEFSLNAIPRLNQFNPELIFISAGFDGAEQDKMSNLNLTEFDYLWITRRIKQIAEACCQGRIISALEGGYALDSLGGCVAAHLRGLCEN